MNFKEYYHFVEALKPSQFRGPMKVGKENKFDTRYDYFFKGSNRKYVPFRADESIIYDRIQRKITNILKQQGYAVNDYLKGIAQELGPEEEIEITDKQGNKRKVKKKKKIIKIGKLLANYPDLLKSFNEDPERAGSRSKQVGHLIVISRHPYDIAGMSTDRGWTSCMNLEKGCNRQFVTRDIEEGTLVAYLIRSDDKNIKRPLARLLFKPHEHSENGPSNIILVPDAVYGTDISGFKQTATDIINKEINSHSEDGTYHINRNVYQDDVSGIATKQGDNINSEIDINDIDSISPQILASSHFVDMLDRSEYGYEIYDQDWDDFPTALQNNYNFEQRYIENHTENIFTEPARSWESWDLIPSIVKNSRNFASDWVDFNSELFQEADWEDIPQDLKDLYDEDTLAEVWISHRSDILSLPWEEFSSQGYNEKEPWVEQWSDWEDNKYQFYDKDWDSIPDGVKYYIGLDYWDDKIHTVDDIPHEKLDKFTINSLYKKIFKKNPDEFKKVLADKNKYMQMDDKSKEMYAPYYISSRMTNDNDVDTIGKEIFSNSEVPKHIKSQAIQLFNRNNQ